MNTEINIPKLRFREFKGEWKEEKFHSIVERIKKTSTNSEYKKIEYSNINEGKLNNELSQNDTTGILFLKKDILFGKLRPYLKNWYYAQFNGVAVGDFWVLRHKEKVSDARFIYYLIQTNRYNKIANYTTGTKMPRSDWNLVSNSLFFISNLQEQQRIGSFFAKIDKIIELQVQKLEQLKKLEQGYLQKMFPKDGESVPRLRFKGFDDDLRIFTYNDIFDGFSYGLSKSGKPYDGKNKYLRITDISDDSRAFIKKNLVSPNINFEDKENDSYLLSNDDIVFARTGASTGKTYLYNKDDGRVYYAGFLIKGHVNESFDSMYIFTSTLTERFFNFVKITSMRSGQPGINSKEYSEYKLNIPRKGEQQKIGKFFSKLDQLINDQSNKLEALKKQKKAYLQKMFI